MQVERSVSTPTRWSRRTLCTWFAIGAGRARVTIRPRRTHVARIADRSLRSITRTLLRWLRNEVGADRRRLAGRAGTAASSVSSRCTIAAGIARWPGRALGTRAARAGIRSAAKLAAAAAQSPGATSSISFVLALRPARRRCASAAGRAIRSFVLLLIAASIRGRRARVAALLLLALRILPLCEQSLPHGQRAVTLAVGLSAADALRPHLPLRDHFGGRLPRHTFVRLSVIDESTSDFGGRGARRQSHVDHLRPEIA